MPMMRLNFPLLFVFGFASLNLIARNRDNLLGQGGELLEWRRLFCRLWHWLNISKCAEECNAFSTAYRFRCTNLSSDRICGRRAGPFLDKMNSDSRRRR